MGITPGKENPKRLFEEPQQETYSLLARGQLLLGAGGGLVTLVQAVGQVANRRAAGSVGGHDACEPNKRCDECLLSQQQGLWGGTEAMEKVSTSVETPGEASRQLQTTTAAAIGAGCAAAEDGVGVGVGECIVHPQATPSKRLHMTTSHKRKQHPLEQSPPQLPNGSMQHDTRHATSQRFSEAEVETHLVRWRKRQVGGHGTDSTAAAQGSVPETSTRPTGGWSGAKTWLRRHDRNRVAAPIADGVRSDPVGSRATFAGFGVVAAAVPRCGRSQGDSGWSCVTTNCLQTQTVRCFQTDRLYSI